MSPDLTSLCPPPLSAHAPPRPAPPRPAPFFSLSFHVFWSAPQSSLKKSEWETKPEGYRDPANAAKLAAPGAQQATEMAEQVINANL